MSIHVVVLVLSDDSWFWTELWFISMYGEQPAYGWFWLRRNKSKITFGYMLVQLPGKGWVTDWNDCSGFIESSVAYLFTGRAIHAINWLTRVEVLNGKDDRFTCTTCSAVKKLNSALPFSVWLLALPEQIFWCLYTHNSGTQTRNNFCVICATVEMVIVMMLEMLLKQKISPETT
jgi:hypothetical protein